MPKLTKRVIDEAKPSAKRLYLWDAETPGFGLLILPSGVKSFICQYRNKAGRSRRATLGRVGTVTVDQARQAARELRVDVSKGQDPVGSKRAYREAATVSDLLDRYLKEHVAKHNAAKTKKDMTALIEKHVRPRLGRIKANDLTRADIARFHASMEKTPRQANLAISALSKALTLAEIWGLRPENSNPCGLIKRYAENHRTRFLNSDELQRLGAALVEAETIGLPWQIKAEGSKHLAKENNQRTPLSWQAVAVVRLLLLTGARLSEITTLQWEHINFEQGTIALPERKGGKRQPYPASTTALGLLVNLPKSGHSIYVFPRTGDAKRPITSEVMEQAWQRLRWAAQIEDARLHDLRHTSATHAAQSGVSAFILKDMLRHKNIATSQRYVNFNENPVRSLANQTADRIAANMASKPTAEIIPLPSAKALAKKIE